MNEVFFSVVTISRNDQNGFIRTRESLTSQSFKNYEHIQVVHDNDKSTINMARGWLSYNNKLIVQFDDGIYKAMNLGINNSKGKLIIFMNSGDEFYSDQTLYRIWKHYKNQNFNWAIGGYAARIETSKVVLDFPRAPTVKDLRKKIFKFSHQATVYDLSFIKALGGYDEKFKISGDYELNLRARIKCAPDKINTLIAIVDQGGISQQNPKNALKEDYLARKKLFNSRHSDILLNILILYKSLFKMYIGKVLQRISPRVYKKVRVLFVRLT